MAEKILMKGNEAFCEAAIRGGVRYYFGYPITPQSEVPEYMAAHLEDDWGGHFLQAESELGAVNMGLGAACGGGNVMLSSSSPGIALMQEGFSGFATVHAPVLIVSVSRGGPGIGDIRPSQADYRQATRGGGNGDYHLITFGPTTLQEAVDLIYEGVALADEYRNPVCILCDAMMGQMMEAVVLPEPKEPVMDEATIRKNKPWALTGQGDRAEKNRIHQMPWSPEELMETNLFQKKFYDKAERELVRYQTQNLEDAEIVFVSYGTPCRITREAMGMLAEEGIKTGLIRPISLWPFPYKAFDEIGPKTKCVISVELSLGQMLDDVKLGVSGRWPVGLICRTGGVLFTSREIADEAKEFLKGVK